MNVVRSLCVFALLVASVTAAEEDAPSYGRTIQPILAKHCFACHGPDEATREAELRLDIREAALEAQAIVPGKPEESQLLARVRSDDEYEVMPPPEAHAPLSDAQKDALEAWITAGAKYEPHWAFTPPTRPDVPQVGDQQWCRTPVDNFALRRITAAGVTPAPEADRYTLVRRVFLDLTGLPPTIEEADRFVNDTDPLAYERLVDRLLASPAYGERFATPWLDLARYADTNGYEKDRPRNIWPYRDYVIDALNADKPYDLFTVEQLAGDMLPSPTREQLTATGFHRNTMLNEEGGIDPLEYRFHALVDRVATTGTVWLGLTTGCAQCHSHKYDPISHQDYYALFALLNNADEPAIELPDESVQARRERIDLQIAKLTASLAEKFPVSEEKGSEAERREAAIADEVRRWTEEQRSVVMPWTVLEPVSLSSNLPKLRPLGDGSILSTGDITKRDVYRVAYQPAEAMNAPITALRLEVLPHESLPARGPGRAFYEGRQGDFFLSEATATVGGRPVHFAAAHHTYGKISVGSGKPHAKNVIDGEGSTGWSTSGREGERNVLVLIPEAPIETGEELAIELLFERHFAASLGRFRFSVTSAPAPDGASDLSENLEATLLKDPQTWSTAEREQVRKAVLLRTPKLADIHKELARLKQVRPDLPTTPVFRERPADNPRLTYRHHRGEYLSPQEPVAPAVPKLFPPLPEGSNPDRLAFAKWLVSERNPLAARVVVNRAWREFFGAGLVRTSGDFGTQSEPPTHPELLDWLAVEFVASGWSQKALHRAIVTSATYRQSSQSATDALRASDPDNRLLARGPRFRMPAEMLRDSMLAASGRIDRKSGGPGVRPPQPESVTALAYGSPAWVVTEPDRRSVYTFRKRTAPFAADLVFGAPSREVCVARRTRSNTPLQALTLLNDELFLSLGRSLAAEVLQSASDREARMVSLFRRVLVRPPTTEEVRLMEAFLERQQERFAAGELTAERVLNGQPGGDELAAWSMLARVVLNLDEAVTKP